MNKAPKDYAVIIDPMLHKALQAKSLVSGISISELVNEAVCEEILEDFRDAEHFKIKRLIKGENDLTP